MRHERKRKLWHACAFAAGIFVLVSIAVALHSQAPNKNEASCRAFVQQFYDWYLGQGCAWYDVAKLKPQVLNSKLLKLLKKEDATQTACKCIDHLDADPFLNSQDPDPKYVVKGVTVANGRCNATVKGAGEDAAEVRPELVRTATGWIFVNFHYSFYSEDRNTKLFPDADLIRMLKP